MVSKAPKFARPDNTDEMVLVEDIVPHPENSKIYNGGEIGRDYAEFQASIARGILQPLVVCYDKKLKADKKGHRKLRLLAGHRRLSAARSLKIAEVPCIVYGELPPKKQLEILVHSNRQRKKTKAELQHEVEALLPAARQKAAETRGQKGKGKGTAASSIAKKTGESERNVQRRVQIADAKEKIDADPSKTPKEKQAARTKIEKATAKSVNAGVKEAQRQVAGSKTPSTRPKKPSREQRLKALAKKVQKHAPPTVKGSLQQLLDQLMTHATQLDAEVVKELSVVFSDGYDTVAEFSSFWSSEVLNANPPAKKTRRKAQRKSA